MYLGSDEFFEEMQSHIDNDKDLSEVPLSQRRQLPKALDYYEHKYTDRNLAICNAYQSGGYTLKEIGEHFGLHYSTVSGVIKHHKSKT